MPNQPRLLPEMIEFFFTVLLDAYICITEVSLTCLEAHETYAC